jgi:elongation factor Ts
MDVTPAMVKELRERTGAGMMDCKKALVESQGDIESAAELLRKQGAAKADKKASRVAAEGCIVLARDEGAGRYVLVEVNSETDFVAKDANFRVFADKVANAALEHTPASVEALMAFTVGGTTLEQARTDLITKIGENIGVRRFEILQTKNNVGAYVHGSRIGVLVEVEGGTPELARDLAMQVASLAPRYLSNDDVPKDALEKEREIILAQTAEESASKPPEIVAKMVEGKLRKYLDEITLTGQVFVKDDKKRVRDLLAQAKAKVKRFVRYEVGEGIEKKADNFVEEVMAQARESR